MRKCRLRFSRALIGAALTAPVVASADEPAQPLHWDPAWTHVGPADYALTCIGLTSLAVELTVLQSKQPPLRWTGPTLFDQATRDLLRGSTAETRDAATVASWTLLAIDISYPVVVDVPYAWARYGPRVAGDLFWQDSTVLSLAAAAGGTTSECLTSTESTRSFPGGHMAVATAGAVLVCMQHLKMSLYGGRWDAVACTAALASALAVGVLRIVTDNHWATDVVAGSALGFAFGWGVPVLMHLHGHASSSTDPLPLVAPFPLMVNHGAGLGVTGLF
jgi:membrane-associated phospholipid phosphatase